MAQIMSSEDNNFDSNEEGFNRVLKDDGKFAAIAWASDVEYFANRNCKVTQIKDGFGDANVAFALQKGTKCLKMWSVL